MSAGGGITTLMLREGDTVLLGVFGELDVLTGPELRAVVADCLASRPARLVMDVSAVTFCDAAGLSALEAARDSAEHAGAEFALAGVRPALLRILSITRLDAVFGLRPRHGPAASPGTAAP
ncbi:STAS domain-containing protein [Streptomyces sp900105245]|uniref:Anti-sigma factor antagonist n=1 Tax=Streptomyces sp. 900105245 TaxID=3154379 RepID=A0ABV1ULV7_9ACTN